MSHFLTLILLVCFFYRFFHSHVPSQTFHYEMHLIKKKKAKILCVEPLITALPASATEVGYELTINCAGA